MLGRKYGKSVVVATEMLESMTHSIRPTRAEVSDVANAVYELASATMLSGETAMGINPIRATELMNKIELATEKHINYNEQFTHFNHLNTSVTDSVSKSSCTNAIALKAKVMVVYTHTGESARLLSKYRTDVPILAITPYEHVFHSLALVWGVTPYQVQENQFDTEQSMHDFAKQLAKKLKLAKDCDTMIVQHGRPNIQGSTDTLKVLTCN